VTEWHARQVGSATVCLGDLERFHHRDMNEVATRTVLFRWRWFMEQSDEPQELERKIEQATRIASRVADQTTVERLRAWIEDLKQKLRQRRETRRIK